MIFSNNVSITYLKLNMLLENFFVEYNFELIFFQSFENHVKVFLYPNQYFSNHKAIIKIWHIELKNLMGETWRVFDSRGVEKKEI